MSWVLKDGADKYGGIIIVVVVVNKYNALIIGVDGGWVSVGWQLQQQQPP
jgi:hypothetical protein